MLKRLDELIEDVKEKFDRLHRTVENGFNYLGMVSEGVKMAMTYFGEKKTNKN
jgi:hypothetical protein